MTNKTNYISRKAVGTYLEQQALTDIGLTTDILKQGIVYTYHILDLIDKTLTENGAFHLSQMMELANLSTFVGNLLVAGIANASHGLFKKNSPHKYPDSPFASESDVCHFCG